MPPKHVICLQFLNKGDNINYYDNTLKKEVPFYLFTKREHATAENMLVSKKGEVPFGVAQQNERKLRLALSASRLRRSAPLWAIRVKLGWYHGVKAFVPFGDAGFFYFVSN